MEQLITFDSDDFSAVRAVMIDDAPWFVGKDIAAALGYANPRDALARHVDEDDKGVVKCDTPGGAQSFSVINESGMYSLVLTSQLPCAKKFKRWVTADVLPTLRKTGLYQLCNAETLNNGFTTAEWLRAATILSSCPKNRFEVVSDLLRTAGFPINVVSAETPHGGDLKVSKGDGNKSPIANRTAFQENLVRLMDEQNLTIKQLAEKTGYSRTIFYAYIDGSAAPRHKYIPAIAEALGVTVDELLGTAQDSESNSEE